MSSSRSTGMCLYHSLLLAIDMMACTFRNPSSKVICMSCAVTWGDLMRNDLAKKSSDEHWPEDPLETLPTRDEPTRSLSSTCRSKAVSPRHVYVQFPSLDALHALCGQSHEFTRHHHVISYGIAIWFSNHHYCTYMGSLGIAM